MSADKTQRVFRIRFPSFLADARHIHGLEGRFCYAVEAIYKTIEVDLGLFFSPSVNRIIEDRLEIGFGQF